MLLQISKDFVKQSDTFSTCIEKVSVSNNIDYHFENNTCREYDTCSQNFDRTSTQNWNNFFFSEKIFILTICHQKRKI